MASNRARTFGISCPKSSTSRSRVRLEKRSSPLSLTRLREVEDFGQLIPKVRALFEATYIAGLRKAGMPDE